MLKKLGFKTLALAAGLAVAAPVISLARDRDDYRQPTVNRYERHDRDDRGFRDRDDHRRTNVRVYSAPQVSGYCDRYGHWHAYGYYDRWGIWHANGY